MLVTLDYDRHTALVSRPGVTALDFAANRSRQPVAFRGRVKEPLLLRQLLLAQHTVMQSDGSWRNRGDLEKSLDPVVTVHHDQIFFESFSQDGSCYARLAAPLSAFDVEGEVRYGTTNIDFAWDLREVLQEVRSSRQTYFSIGVPGPEEDAFASASAYGHFARKIDVTEKQLRGFLQVQSALSMRSLFTFSVRPVDLLTISAFIKENRTPPRSTRALRFELRTGEPIGVVLEPWPQRITLRDSHYAGYERTVRVWGRHRLNLLNDVLPYAQRVTVGVLGRGLPHIYLCHCGPYQFLLALSGWSSNDWSSGNAFDLMAPLNPNPDHVARVHAYLVEHLAAPRDQIAANTGLSVAEVEGALFQLCRTGKAMYDLATRQYRLRELFAESLPDEILANADPRLVKAQQLFVNGHVRLTNAVTKGRSKETTITAKVMDGITERDVLLSISEDGRIRFARCDCPFFEANLLARGPCEHILAVRLAADAAPATPEAAPVSSTATTSEEDESDDEDEADEDEGDSDVPF